VYIGGNFIVADNTVAYGLALWDGQRLGPGQASRNTLGLNLWVAAFASDGTNLFVGGYFDYAGTTKAARVARFDGMNWSGFGSGPYNYVYVLACLGTNLYAAGEYFWSDNSVPLGHFIRWNGTEWVAPTTAFTNYHSTSIRALSVRGQDLFIAGYFGAD